MTAQLVAQHLAALASQTAIKLGKESKVNRELREAIQLEKLDANSVRIGKYDIRRKETSEGPLFSIHKSAGGNKMVSDMVFYETCRFIVGLLNQGSSSSSFPIIKKVDQNKQYRRLLSDIYVYREQIAFLTQKGSEDKIAIIEDRLGDALSKADLLRRQLLSQS